MIDAGMIESCRLILNCPDQISQIWTDFSVYEPCIHVHTCSCNNYSKMLKLDLREPVKGGIEE